MKKIILSLAASGLCLSLFGCSSAVAPTQSTAETTAAIFFARQFLKITLPCSF